MPRSRSAAVVRGLKGDAEVALADQGDGLLQLVLVAPRDAHLVALDRRLHLQLRVLDLPDDFLRLLRLDPLHDLDVLPYRAAGGLLDLLIVERLQGYVAL